MARRPNIAYVADLSNRLLKAQEEVKRLQREWDALFSAEAPSSSVSSSATGSRAPNTVARIIELLNSNVGKGFTADEVADALGSENRPSIGTTLSKLVRANRIRKFGINSYQSLEAGSNPSALGMTEDFGKQNGAQQEEETPF